MRKLVSMGLVLALLMLLAAPAMALETLPLPIPAEPGAAPSAAPVGKITVEGSATVKVKPDVAYVTLGVQTQAEDAVGAQAENTRLMSAVIEAIKAQGVADKDIRTEGFYINANYNYETQQANGYSAQNNVTVTVRDIALVSGVIDAAVAAGANNAQSVSFNVSDPEPSYREALKGAIQNARRKAVAIAAAMDVGISLPSEVAELTRDDWYGSAKGNFNTALSDSGAESTPIQSGEIEITARVQVVYPY